MPLAKWLDIWKRFTGKGTYPHELAFLLNLPLRRWVFSPADLVGRLHLTPQSRVLEIGPGPGYFSPAVARTIPRGHLALLDIQSEMLAKARAKLRRAGAANVSFTRGSASALPYRTASFDVVFLVAVLGEVPDPAACMRSVHRVLRPGGIVSVTELPGDPDALSSAEITAMAESSDLARQETLPAPRGFTANYRKTEASTED